MFARDQSLSRVVGSVKINLPLCCIRQVQMYLQRYCSLSPVRNLCDTPLVMKSWTNLGHHSASTATTTLASSELVSWNRARRPSRWRNTDYQGRNQSALMLLPSAFKEEVIVLWQCDVYSRFLRVLFTGRKKLHPVVTYKGYNTYNQCFFAGSTQGHA
jgi:hypothetical protein